MRVNFGLPSTTWIRWSLLVLCGVCGCGGTPHPTGDVTGIVTLEGEPIATGSVSFISAEGKAATSPLNEIGEYAMKKVPVGEYKVLVLPPELPPPGKPGTVKKKGQAEFPDYPKKYRSDLTTDLKTEVFEGSNELDFDLKPDAGRK